MPSEAPFAAVDDAYRLLAAMAAERPVLDEPKAIGLSRPHVGQRKWLHDPPFQNCVCGSSRSASAGRPNWMIVMGRVELHHARRAQA